MNYRILTLCIMLMTAGRVSVSHTVGDGRWFNASLPIHLQHTLYHQERAYCAQAADQWIQLLELTFGFGGVRHINGAPNVSAKGNQTAVTTGPADRNAIPSLVFQCWFLEDCCCVIGQGLRRVTARTAVHDLVRLAIYQRYLARHSEPPERNDRRE